MDEKRPGVTELIVNGKKHTVPSANGQTLLFTLRDELHLTGAKYGCGEGQCGACTVLADGKPIRSCITPVASAAGKSLTTIEGLEQDGKLHPVQEAFLADDAMQCGYCIPGMIMSSVGLLKKNAHPTESEILQAMQGNVCRCGTYPLILAAIRRAAGTGGTKG